MAVHCRLVYVQWMFLFLTLCVLMSMFSRQFHDWLTSNSGSLNLAIKQDGAPYYNHHNTRQLLDPHKEHFNKTLPSVCVFPRVGYEPWVVKVAGLNKEAISCVGNYLTDLTYITRDLKLKVNRSKVAEYKEIRDLQQCRYRHVFHHETNGNNYIYSDWSKPFIEFTELPTNAEFLQVECTNKEFQVVLRNFHGLIHRQEQFDNLYVMNFKKHQVNSAPRETLNVIIIGIDEMSRTHFLRGCNKTYSYLMNTLKSFDLTMHSQLGGNMVPNFWPLFTGISGEEVEKWCLENSRRNTIDVIWRAYENAGYRTLLTENEGKVGVFHDFLKGCGNTSVRYTMHPLVFAMYTKENASMHKRNYHCSENQVEMNAQLDYISRFLDTFPEKPVFAVAMLTRPSRKDPDSEILFDKVLLNFYASLNQNGHLNKSMLVSLSYHGVRRGGIRHSKNGDVESKTPYTLLTFPEWFLKKYPDVVKNLKRNTRRLTSHFDTHATLFDLLYFKSNTPPPLAPLRDGISLLSEIPWNRTCRDALIPSDSCLCGYTYLEDVYLTSQLSTVLVQLVIKAINSKTDKHKCAFFKLQQVIRIQKLVIDQYHSTGIRGTIVYTVKLKVKPGNALFQASVYELNQFNEWKVGNQIDRLNQYKGQSECMESQTFRPFCYCRNVESEQSSQ